MRKFVSVPFVVEIAELIPSGTTVRVPVRSASAFGGIPIPRFLFALVKNQLPRELLRYEEPATFIVSLDRFLPRSSLPMSRKYGSWMVAWQSPSAGAARICRLEGARWSVLGARKEPSEHRAPSTEH